MPLPLPVLFSLVLCLATPCICPASFLSLCFLAYWFFILHLRILYCCLLISFLTCLRRPVLSRHSLASSAWRAAEAGTDGRAETRLTLLFTACPCVCQAPPAAPRRSEATTASIDTSEHRGGSAAPSKRIPSGGGGCCWVQCKAMETEKEQTRPNGSCHPPTRPPWLQAAITDIEQRVRALAVGVPDDAAAAATDHSFAERAENYYHKRPQLLALLTDLHHRYLYLADRYSQSLLAKPHHIHATASDCSSDVDDRSSDVDSSLSYQPPACINVTTDESALAAFPADADLLVAELVAAWVDRDILADQAERRKAESARKIELQGSLLEVLESERLVLLGENARLGFRASAAEEEAAAAAAELGYMRRRAAEMARLVVKLREDHRVCMLGRKIEALQSQVYGLELRNRECYEAMAAWETERKVGVAEIERLRAENRQLAAEAARRKRKGGSGWGWWARVRLAAEWTPCTPTEETVRKVGEQMKGKDGKYNGGCFCL